MDRLFLTTIPDDVQALRKSRIIVVSALALAVIVPTGVALRLTIAGLHPAAVAVALGCTAMFAATPWVLRVSGSPRLAGRLVSSGYFLLVVGTAAFVGGLDSPVLAIAPLIPLVAVFMLELRAGFLATVLLSGVIVLFAALPYLGVELPASELTPPQKLIARALLLLIAIVLALVFVTVFETQRQRAELRLRRSEDLYRRIFEQSKDVVILSSREGQLLDVNRAGLELFGFASKEEMLRHGVDRFYTSLEARRAMLEELEARGYVQNYETEHRTSAGECRILQGTTSTIVDESGRVTRLLAILRDVTRERRVETEREAMLAALERKNAELERFAYTVSHDLKSPLVTIQGFVGLLRKDAAAGDPELLEKDFVAIERAAGKMKELIDDLLELSRIGRRDEPWSEVSTTAVVEEVLELLAGRIAEAGVHLEIAAELPVVRGDRTLLRLVWQNLIDNAVKFSACRPSPRVEIGVRRDGDGTVFFVADNGPGIPPQSRERIFEIFEKLDTAGSGTGIGLASVQRAVAVHGGRVWVESEGEGKGSTFCFTLAQERRELRES